MKELSEVSLQLLCKEYLAKDSSKPECPRCQQHHESIEELWDRVSFGKSEYRDLISNLDFLPNSPTLYSAGLKTKGTLSACFKFDIADDLESIMDVAKHSAFVQKWGGGVGYCLSALRPKGTHIASTHGKACGPVATLYLYHAVADPLITQGGRRMGAQMAILHCDHPDIMDFINCKDAGETLNTFNLSVAATDAFMSRALEGDNKIFDAIVNHAWKFGDPGLYFIDEAERHNPTPQLGKLTGTNPCGEVPLLDNEACNLASINLSNFVKDGKVEYNRLSYVAGVAAKYLDEVIDHNHFPVEEVTQATLRTRKLGLGVMGWADMLALLHIPYDCKSAVELAEQVMETVQLAGHMTSHERGEALGVFPAFDGKVTKKMRNATVTCIAPAGSISTIADCSSGIEPHFALEYKSVMGDGTELKRRMRVLDLCGPFVPLTAHEIAWKWHVQHQAAFQKHTDLAVSKTINFPKGTPEEEVRKAYLNAWELKCKGTTVYVDGSKNRQAFYKDGQKFGEQKHLPVDVPSKRHRFMVGGVEGFIHTGRYPDTDKLGEIFLTVSKMGSTVDGMMDTLAIIMSVSLQYGVPLQAFTNKLKGRRFEPNGITDDRNIPTATSIPDYLARYLERECDGKTETTYADTGMLCPDCGAKVVMESGCMHCSSCGWSRC